MYTFEEMVNLVNTLNEASKAYYRDDKEIMSNFEYDALYDKLQDMEQKLGIVLSNSPTVNVGYETKDGLVKEKHEEKALSLDKTKDRQGLAEWLGSKIGCLSWKMDGLTTVLTYDNGNLTKAVTRGNGEIGEVVTHNAKHIKNLPLRIPFKGHMVCRGETMMTYSDFEKVNASILDVALKYKNPRNLASGTLRSLDSKVAAERGLIFKAFELVTVDGSLPTNSFSSNLDWLKKQGFDIVDYIKVNSSNTVKGIEYFETKLNKNDFPSDGLVLQLDDIAYGKSLGVTGKYPKNGKAFKWQDETANTIIRKIEWNAGRTGLINPVAVFDPVELEGTTVSRATANNVSFMEKLQITVGSTVSVYKANMIIPTIASNLKPVGNIVLPKCCPSCGGPVQIRQTAEAKVLFCANSNCPAKNLKHFVHFVSRDAMNIVGLSEKTLEKLIENGFIQNYYDLYLISNRPDVVNMEGFGSESYKDLLNALEVSKDVSLGSYLYAFGIDMVGKQVAKDIANHAGNITNLIHMLDNNYDFRQIDGIGDKIVTNLYNWWNVSTNRHLFMILSTMMKFKPIVLNINKQGSNGISGKTFCVTGSVSIFSNRNEVGKFIEEHGGKLASSVTSKTDYLVTNDTTSGSSKNKKAQELGKPILTEQELIDLGGGM